MVLILLGTGSRVYAGVSKVTEKCSTVHIIEPVVVLSASEFKSGFGNEEINKSVHYKESDFERADKEEEEDDDELIEIHTFSSDSFYLKYYKTHFFSGEQLTETKKYLKSSNLGYLSAELPLFIRLNVFRI